MPLQVSMSPRRHSLPAKSFDVPARVVKCKGLVMPQCRACMDPTSVGQPGVNKRHPHRPNLQFDILPTVTFVTIAAASLSAQRPLPVVVVRFV